MTSNHDSLSSHLKQPPQPLQFGTSGRRGLLAHLSQLEVYVNALAELEYLQSLSSSEGGIVKDDVFFFAYDLRPSSSCFVGGEPDRGELAQAIVAAIRDAGMVPVNLGRIPTPALTSYALAQGKGSIMVTGSHIPFDRNGYKVNTARGELLKEHEAAINVRVGVVRERVYSDGFANSPFDEDGLFKVGHMDLPAENRAGAEAYLRRYSDFFGAEALSGLKLLVYQHSAVGRDLLVDILRGLGAEVIAAGRSETFVPIDTENMDEAQLSAIQRLYDEACELHGVFDAVVSTDGDSDRPLLLGVDGVGGRPPIPTFPLEGGRGAAGRVRFFGGDLVGMITAQFLGADAVVVPISCNDGIDRGGLKPILEPKTRIGSPYVIAGMEAARARGKRAVCGWEANGGFLTGSDIVRNGRTLTALPTRDAVLPIVAVLSAARERGLSVSQLFAQLPRRFSRAALLKQFPRSRSLAIIRGFSPMDPAIAQADFTAAGVSLTHHGGTQRYADDGTASELHRIRDHLATFFAPADGFGIITAVNFVDGVRILFGNGDVAHLRPSGNADELRIYAVADTQIRADAIAALAVKEPHGILRSMEKALPL